MNKWANTVLTDSGLALMAKLTQGNTLNITKAVTGAGFVTPGVLSKQRAVTTPKQTMVFKPVTYPETGKCAITVELRNEDLTTGYNAKQVGLYAEDPDEGEILLLIAQTTDEQSGTIIPSANEMPGYSAEWTFYLQYGQADGVNLTVEPTNSVSRAELTWENVKNKPTVLVPVDALDYVEWDGDRDGREKTQNANMYKVSDAVPEYAAVVEAGAEMFVHVFDISRPSVPLETRYEQYEDGSFSITTDAFSSSKFAVFVAARANATGGGITAPTPGVYLGYDDMTTYFVERLRFPGYEWIVNETEEKMAPEVLYQPNWAQTDGTQPDFIKNKPAVVVSTDVRKITAGTEDLEAGISELETGTLYLVYE